MSLLGVVQRDTIKPQEETTIETYDATAALVIEEFSKLGESATYAETRDIRETMRETRLPFDVVWEMVGFRDEMDWVESD